VHAAAEARRDERARRERLEVVGLCDDSAGRRVAPGDLLFVVGGEQGEFDGVPGELLFRRLQGM